ncbi:MAG: chitobiase/beta-hexosaminidase C-terminal domain-containing protein [Bacteroidales bacterium]|nr:chitobiase/beta-hexosaminidase C-terminal domain-containing protein [Bacteroidales bacterium]
MKKLTWALLSLMLFLGLGVASAQTVPAPSLDPADGATVTPKASITPLGETECVDFMMSAMKLLYVMYIWDDAATELKAIEDVDVTIEGGAATYKVDVWAPNDDMDGGNWLSGVVAPEEAGSHTLRVRLVATPFPFGGFSAQAKAGDFNDATYLYGEEITATYTVAGEAVVETVDAPTLSPAGGAVTADSKVNIEYQNLTMHNCYYVINDPTFDFSAITHTDNIDYDVMNMDMNGWVKITEATTITVAIAKLNMDGSIAAWSDPVTGTYTIPAAPAFNPDGGTIALDAQISLTTTTTGGKIYYTNDASAFASIKTEEALKSSSAVQEYFDDDKITLEELGVDGGEQLTIVAATAVINSDGSVAWSSVNSKTFTAEEGEAPADGVAQPVISPKDAFVKVGDKVTISCKTPEAKIYYTLDGTEPSASSTEYTAPIEITVAMVPNNGELQIRAIAIKDGKEAMAHTALTIRPDAPTFDPEAGEVAFGASVELSCNLSKAKIYYTTDGTTPTDESTELDKWDVITITKAMTVKAIAVLGHGWSDVAEAAYTVIAPKAKLTLEPMQEDMVGKNVGTDFSFIDPEDPASAGWIQQFPASVYYTVDGVTVPSKAAYDAQADKENGAIKMLSVKWEEDEYGYYGPVSDGEGNLMPVMFSEPTRLKAIGYLMEDDDVLVTTALLDTMLQVKAEANPDIEIHGDDMIVMGTEVTVGDTIIVKNPNYLPEAPEYNASDEEWDAYDELVANTPSTTLYYSFDGTLPTMAAFNVDEQKSVFAATRQDGSAGENITLIIKKDDEGFYAFVPTIFSRYYDEDLASIRFEDGKLPMQVLAVTSDKQGGDDFGGLLSASPKWGMPGGAKPFQYGSDFVKVEYTAFDWELPATVTAPTFVPAPEAGSLAQGDAIKFGMDAAYEKYGRHGGVAAVAYVINGTDADLNIDAAKLEALLDASDPDGAGVREDGKVYLYEGEATAFEIEKTCSVKACQIVAIVVEGEDGESTVQLKLSEIVTANYTVDASKLQKPTIKTPIAGSTVEPNSPITFEMPARYDWTAYTNLAYVLYVENNAEVKLEGTAEEIMNAVSKDPVAGAKAGEPAYKVVECAKMGDELSWTEALIETAEGALTIRARLAGININDEVFYSDEVTVSCTVEKGEPDEPGTDPTLPETVKTPTFVPAAGAVEKGTAITWTWDEAYNEETYPLVAVAYVVNGDDADLDITEENFNELWEASQEEDETTVREEGVTYLYRTDADDPYPYHIEKACTVKARMLLGVVNLETGEISIALSSIVEAAYTIKAEPAATVAKPTFSPVAGAVKRGTKVEIACTTEGAKIYYTVDGSVPTEKSTEYKEAIVINDTMTIKAIAIKGEAKSEVAEAAYTIDVTANEDRELAGVSVYPNPSNGVFNLELPVAATVEVFASNGVLVQRMKLSEGKATLNIDRSGIYILRITGEGRTTVKRLIVR